MIKVRPEYYSCIWKYHRNKIISFPMCFVLFCFVSISQGLDFKAYPLMGKSRSAV